MNVYSLGECEINEDYSFHNHGDFVFQKSTSKNMDKLWSYFHSKQSYPDYYLGKAKRVAICKCPITEKEQWFNAERSLSVDDPVIGSTVTVHIKIKNKIYTREFLFLGWAQTPVHEWSMTQGTTLQLEQKFVDGLSAVDRRYLKMKC